MRRAISAWVCVRLGSTPSNQARASLIASPAMSEIDLPPTFTASASGFRRAPWQVSQGVSD